LSIFGPSGVGKTTTTKLLARNYSVFIETTEGNPHLEGLLTGKADFNAMANQEWFLNRVEKHIAGANPRLPLILDQDPAAIVLAYSRMFLDEGKISEAQYDLLLQRLLKIEEILQAWQSPRMVLFLDAPAEVLHERALRCSGTSRTPPLEWFERVRGYFVELFPFFPNVFSVSTADLGPEQVVAKAKALIQSHTQDGQA
jgi:deoxyadenosine/deoxycytidine kinase